MLTAQEEQMLAQLEAEEAAVQQMAAGQAPMPQPTPSPSGLTPQEEQMLAFLEAEEAQAQQMQQQAPQELPEASLGFATRAQYAIEPLESNRRALLVQQFGEENVREDAEGNLYLKQYGQFRPVNAPGFSTADVADLLGATPESVGAAAGGALGMGPATIPGAIGGAVAGSAFRQGLSAALGTPQVAGAAERAAETGMSAAFGLGGALIGRGGKAAVQKIFPRFKIREGVKKLAKELDVPDPSPGQLAGGRDLEIEKQLAETPFFGRKIRKRMEKQANAIKKNLTKQFGDFADLDLDRAGAGSKIKEQIGTYLKDTKGLAGSMFDDIAEQGGKIKVPKKMFNDEFIDEVAELGLFTKQGGRTPFTATPELTPDQFSRLQDVLGGVIDSVRNAPGDSIDARTINSLRKYIDANIKEAGKQGYEDAVLIEIRGSLMDLTEGLLKKESPGLATKFKDARALYKQYLDGKRLFEQTKNGLNIKNLSDEKVLERIFRDKKSVNMYKELVDEDTLKSAGDHFVNDILRDKIGKEGKVTAQGALSAVRKKREAIRAAIGGEEYSKLVKNLEFLNMIGEPINPSKTAITELRTAIVKGGMLRGQQAVRRTVSEAVEKMPERSMRAAQVLTDPVQREASYDFGQATNQWKERRRRRRGEK